MLMGPKLDVFECDVCKGMGKVTYQVESCTCEKCAEPNTPRAFYDAKRNCEMCDGRGFILEKVKDGQ
jgi:hypothetical protein